MTRIEVSENRHAIHSLIRDLRKIDSKLENVTENIEKKLIELEIMYNSLFNIQYSMTHDNLISLISNFSFRHLTFLVDLILLNNLSLTLSLLL